MPVAGAVAHTAHRQARAPPLLSIGGLLGPAREA